MVAVRYEQETQNESDNGKVLSQSNEGAKVEQGTTINDKSRKICCKTRTTSNELVQEIQHQIQEQLKDTGATPGTGTTPRTGTTSGTTQGKTTTPSTGNKNTSASPLDSTID